MIHKTQNTYIKESVPIPASKIERALIEENNSRHELAQKHHKGKEEIEKNDTVHTPKGPGDEGGFGL